MTKPIPLFDILGALDPADPGAASAADRRLADDWAFVYHLFLRRDWPGADAALEAFEADHGADGISARLGERCRRHAAEALPDDWDGAMRIDVK